jgi:hypothetical protein
LPVQVTEADLDAGVARILAVPELDQELDRLSAVLAQRIVSGITSPVDETVMADRINEECKRSLARALAMGLLCKVVGRA